MEKKQLFSNKKQFFSNDVKQEINYKNIKLLKGFITEQGKIIPRRATGLNVQQQKIITKAIKQARILSLLPFTSSNAN
jgi:small subunit ribosomal protein S18|tara:strand:+ start:941 stop:1174 length:234 start_codon:yes stop_codon:yes gene_type:complete